MAAVISIVSPGIGTPILSRPMAIATIAYPLTCEDIENRAHGYLGCRPIPRVTLRQKIEAIREGVTYVDAIVSAHTPAVKT
jgi:hypothetical protein